MKGEMEGKIEFYIINDIGLFGEKRTSTYAANNAEHALTQHYGGHKCMSTFSVYKDGRYVADDRVTRPRRGTIIGITREQRLRMEETNKTLAIVKEAPLPNP